MVFQGRIERGMVVLDQPSALPDGTRVRVEPLPLAPVDFWETLSLEQLAMHQGVRVPSAVDSLLGGWPSEDVNDDFDDALHGWRRGEQEAS